jgi:protein-S-isoprenylcysteine O-methyltransferase Ste14
LDDELISKYVNHDKRPDLVGEHKYGDLWQFIVFVIFLTVWISDSFIFHYSDFLRQYINLSIRLIFGLAVLLISAYLAFSGLKIIFGKIREKPEIVREGVFGVIRHPIYLGAILFYIGLFIFTLSLLSLAVIFIIMILYIYLARYEEKLLIKHFGDSYRAYMKNVPGWLPRIDFRKK